MVADPESGRGYARPIERTDNDFAVGRRMVDFHVRCLAKFRESTHESFRSTATNSSPIRVLEDRVQFHRSRTIATRQQDDRNRAESLCLQIPVPPAAHPHRRRRQLAAILVAQDNRRPRLCPENEAVSFPAPSIHRYQPTTRATPPADSSVIRSGMFCVSWSCWNQLSLFLDLFLKNVQLLLNLSVVSSISSGERLKEAAPRSVAETETGCAASAFRLRLVSTLHAAIIRKTQAAM